MLGALALASILLIFINQILFALEALECRVIDFVYNLFEIFAGIEYMEYNGEPKLFINIFFENPVITNVYIGMCLMSAAAAFGVAIIAVVRKMFDISGEKVKATYGAIITNLFKSILLMFCMTLIVNVSIQASSVIMRQIDYLFDNAIENADPSTIDFDDEDRATMMRIISKIGNYTLNQSSNNRYNINSCFNDIRADMQILESGRTFKYSYEGAEGSWQHALLMIYNAADISTSLNLDEYNQTLTNAIIDCGDRIKNDGTFAPLDSYTRIDAKYNKSEGTIGKTIMLAGSMTSAKNSRYNEGGSLTDGLRRAYYYGDKDCYSWDQMDEDFNIGLFTWDHLVIIGVGWFTLWELVKIMLNAIARVFNIILLYITAPGFLAVMPLDDGGKFKQWTIAFVIQSCSLMGSLVAVRLMVMFIPIVMEAGFVIVPDSTFGNYLAKLIVLCGIVYTAGKASGMISGILADNAGYQSIMAGDVGSGMAQSAKAVTGKALKAVGSTAFSAGSGLLNLGLNQTSWGKAANDAGHRVSQSVQQNGLSRAISTGFETADSKQQAASKAGKAEAAAKEKTESDRWDSLLGSMEKLANGGGGGGGSDTKAPPKLN